MINAKKAKKLRKLLNVVTHPHERTYHTSDGTNHTTPTSRKRHTPIGGRRYTRETRTGIPIFQGTVRLGKHEPRAAYQRIKRLGIITPPILNGEQVGA